MVQFAIPEGTRDLILGEARLKNQLEVDLGNVFERWGYTEIVTPTIEYYETYNNGFGNLLDKKMLRFLDRNGKIMTLRMDMTVPIARVVATKFKNCKPPFRFRYCANVFRVENSLSGMKNELTDCGVELIGLHSHQSDLEILCCAMEALEQLNTKEYILEIGNTEFLRVAFDCMKLEKDVQDKLAGLIHNKEINELNQSVKLMNLDRCYESFLLQLPMLCGNKDILKEAKQYCFNDKLLDIVNEFETLCLDLEKLAYGNKITFDLGKVPSLSYYTGITFEAFVGDIGLAVLSGGRYDKLIEKFGKNLPAVGFSMKLDYILDILGQKKPEKTYVVKYPISKKVEALLKAKELRKTAIVQLEPYDCESLIIEEKEG